VSVHQKASFLLTDAMFLHIPGHRYQVAGQSLVGRLAF
jgi:hypothetical protein